ncbi:tyrosine-type recombinase/integrase [Treponema putidum]|uniref:Tyr recombinase domain-containing protein n=1 Tax=Treponema putidum TaxID=221027 RepID=A0ABY5HQC8_9SPIR|nr:tyrosine-type recombinase/integrase [Treponema putidum]UTY27669.1 hypothetical protein E4N76_00710 [Treponema putidum]
MRNLKKWYTYKRDGIVYVQFKDRITGKKLTAKSTGTRNVLLADEIIREWYYDVDSFFNRGQREKAKNELEEIITASILNGQDIKDVFTKVMSSFFAGASSEDSMMFIENGSQFFIAREQKKPETPKKTSKHSEIQEVMDMLDTLTFKDYLFLFWDYEKSPYIKQLKNSKSEVPYKERFNRILKSINHYSYLLDDVLLKDVTKENADNFLKEIKALGKLKDSSIIQIKSPLVQALRFAHKNGIIDKLITGDMLTSFSAKNDEKEIFTEQELQTIFDKKKNYFENEAFLLINKLLFITGGRIGEVMALHINDLKQNLKGYYLNFDKNYNFEGKYLKCTKTKRKDMCPISNELAEELLEFIKTNPYKNKNGFIFYSEKRTEPLNYDVINHNFHKTMEKLGIKRKRLTLHSYRHTFTSLLQDAGFSDADLLFLTRHDDINQLRRYGGHITPKKEEKKRQAMDIINSYI